MTDDITQLQKEIAELGRRLDSYELSDRFLFEKDLSVLDGKKIYIGTKNGLRIGTSALQKLGFFGTTPVVQGGSISAPSGGITIDSEARAAINSLIARIKNIGITS